MKIRILDEAQLDLIDGFRFYEMQQQGLGSYFLDSLFADIDALHIHAGTHVICFRHYRMLAKRFPYAVYYQMDGDVVSIHAVLDCRRDPMLASDVLGP